MSGEAHNLLKNFLVCACCVSVCAYIHIRTNALTDQKGVGSPGARGVGGNHQMWFWEQNPSPLQAVHALNC